MRVGHNDRVRERMKWKERSEQLLLHLLLLLDWLELVQQHYYLKRGGVSDEIGGDEVLHTHWCMKMKR